MKLRDFFSTTTGSETLTPMSEDMAAGTEAAKYKLKQQIQALMPGQTLQGKIVGRENAQVQIQLASDLLFTARLNPTFPLIWER